MKQFSPKSKHFPGECCGLRGA